MRRSLVVLALLGLCVLDDSARASCTCAGPEPCASYQFKPVYTDGGAPQPCNMDAGAGQDCINGQLFERQPCCEWCTNLCDPVRCQPLPGAKPDLSSGGADLSSGGGDLSAVADKGSSCRVAGMHGADVGGWWLGALVLAALGRRHRRRAGAGARGRCAG